MKLNDGSVTCVFDDEQESRVRFCCLTDKCESYSIPGGEYGEYIFTICLEEAEIKVTVFNTNWWNVADIILICGIDTECHTMTYVLEDQHGVVSAEEDGKTYVIGTMI